MEAKMILRKTVVPAALVLAFGTFAFGQETNERTNRRGDDVTVTRDGQGNVNKTITGSNGKSVTVDKSHGNGDVNKTITGPNGKTTTVDKDYNGNRRYGSVDKTVTGPGGKTANVDKTWGPRGVARTATGPGGNSRTTVHRRHR
jgi:hypothetical protein